MTDPITATVTAAVAAVATKVAKEAAEHLATNILSLGEKVTSKLLDNAVVQFRLGFEDYIVSTYKRCALFKSIISPQIPLMVENNYISLSFKLHPRKPEISDDELMKNINKGSNVIITGLAGSGKSMFMKYMTLKKLEDAKRSLPLFVELRHINNLTDRDLLTFIRVSCSSKFNTVSPEQFELGLRAGAFSLILDGFDEVNYDYREDLQHQIFQLTVNFPQATIVVSSRPDERFGNWTSFSVYEVMPLSQQQTIMLIDKLEYDSGVKDRFKRKAKEALFKTHDTFLASPLLATIMILTFEEYASIPDKMHVFYSQAFETLFSKHDAYKEQFRRKLRSSMSREEFRTCFAAFCAMSYMDQVFSFSPVKLQDTASRALRYVFNLEGTKKKATEIESFVTDLKEAVCMLQPDGLEVAFVHRSFQEYFTAQFITSIEKSKIKKLLDRCSYRFEDSVVPMVVDMDRENLEKEWVIPKVDELLSELRLDTQVDNTGLVMSKMFPTYEFSRGRGVHANRAAFYVRNFEVHIIGPLLTLNRIYGSFIELDRFFNIILETYVEEIRKKLLKPAYSTLPRYEIFEAMLAEEDGSKTGTDDFFHKTFRINGADTWWLDALGVNKQIRNINRGLRDIKKKIQRSQTVRSGILEGLIS